jgi:2-polyprenyl-6-methoxyphenol hydroxylase-like FAD-dependent oxidoreductase
MYEVLIVGYGPTGMMAAALLGRAGHRVAVLERYSTLYNLPRVGIVHDDVLRMFQQLGLIERIYPHTYFLPASELARGDEILLRNTVSQSATHGWPEFTSLYQPIFETELDRLCKSLPTVDVIQGATVKALRQDSDKVDVETADGRVFQGRYLIGADGGNSFVREAVGVPYEDLGFEQDWLVVDARLKNGDVPKFPALRQFCEPGHPWITMQMGPHHRRWSFHFFAGENPDEAVKHENVWKRLDRSTGGTPNEFELIRTVVYRLKSLIAERWRVGRVLLAGDAAHQMPPYLAQGLCSGFRDAHTLAWKLDLVLKGVSTDTLLDSYEAERAPSARDTVIESLRVGQNINERDPAKAEVRDDRLRAMQKRIDAGEKPLVAFRSPGPRKGVIGSGPEAKAAGEPFIQAKVRGDGREGWFDDVAGAGFVMLVRNGEPALSDADRDYWRSLGGKIVRIGRDVVDTEGRYTQWMDTLGCDVVVKRPDNYVFAACRSAEALPALLAELRNHV